jgi:hypothetical protein
MMEVVSDNEWHNAPPPAVRAPNEPVPGPRTPAAAPEPVPIDPEAVRQFQQFQQFQELMRQQGDNALLPPPPKKPLWQRVLQRKLVRRLALLAILLVTAPLWWNLLLAGIVSLATHAFGSNEPPKPASETGGGTYHTNHILKDSPYEAVRQVYQRVADDDPTFACGVFSDGAAQEFANHAGAADCPAAVHQLFGQIDKSQPYKNTWADDQGLPLTIGGIRLKSPPASVSRVEISSCEVTVSPRLGKFTIERVDRGQWLITQHQQESC